MDKIREAQAALDALGLPPAQQIEIAALTLLALVELGPDDSWSAAQRNPRTVSKGIMAFIAERYGKVYAPNTRETVRRQVLHQFLQARLVDYNPFEPDLPTNSPRAHYAINVLALDALRAYGTSVWQEKVGAFVAAHGSLAVAYAGRRSSGKLVPLTLPDGRRIELSPGRHNEVQKAVVELFAPRFAPDGRLLYLGDTARKTVVMESAALAELGLPTNEHDKLPDVVLYDAARRWLFLIEAVSSHGPMSPKRVIELSERLAGKQAGLVFVSAFPDMATFRRHMKAIAWETEVWLADAPDHMIHFNGDRFLGPR